MQTVLCVVDIQLGIASNISVKVCLLTSETKLLSVFAAQSYAVCSYTCSLISCVYNLILVIITLLLN